jgi:hypothetical protein
MVNTEIDEEPNFNEVKICYYKSLSEITKKKLQVTGGINK